MEQKTIKTIQRVAKSIASRYKFGFYDLEDIEQEAFIIAMDAIDKFDPKLSSLENFLYVVLHSRLKNFIRSNYVRKDYVCVYCGHKDPNCEFCKRREWSHDIRKNLLEPIDIDKVNANNESHMSIKSDPLMQLELDEIFSIINKKLDISLRADYLRMLDGVYISKLKREQIENTILGILEEYGYNK